MKQDESELLAKLKEVNLANSEYAKEIEDIKEREKEAAMNEANPFSTFANLQKDLSADNVPVVPAAEEVATEQPVQYEAQEDVVQENDTTTEETVENEPKKTSLQSLLSSAKNLKK